MDHNRDIPAVHSSKKIGESVLRVEDESLLRGLGSFIDDVDLGASTLHVAFVRSPHAHALIRGISTDACRRLKGVVDVWTANDIAGSIRAIRGDFEGPGTKVTTRVALADTRTRFVGDAVAMVLATDPYIAADAVELVEVDYDPLPALVDALDALAGDAPRVHESITDNVACQSAFSSEDFDQKHSKAEFTLRETFVSGRKAALPIEPRGCSAQLDPSSGELTFWSSTQVPHILRNCLSEHLNLRTSDVRVIVPDVGGGFGMKACVYPEEILVAGAAIKLKKPVKWIQDRYDDLLTSAQARDHRYEIEVGFNAQGKLVSLSADVIVNIGAYSNLPFGSTLETNGAARNMPGAYDLRNFRFRTRAVFTNLCPTGAYRGVSAPLACLAMEGMLERIARHRGLDPAEIRRRNLIQKFPYINVLGQTYADGGFAPALDRALTIVGYDDLRSQQASQAATSDTLVGIGISVTTEQTGMSVARYRARGADRIPGFESGKVRVEADGSVTVSTSQSAIGQGHATALSQIVSDRLGFPLSQIKFLRADTARSPFGSGTFASRGIVIAGTAVMNAADKIRARMARIAAMAMQCGADEVLFKDGFAHVEGSSGRKISLREVAATAHAMSRSGMPAGDEFGLEATEVFNPETPQIASAVHIAAVTINRRTGALAVSKYVVIHDCGIAINPTLVDGQIHGGVAQGLGEVLMEHFLYNRDGQPINMSLMDYQLPRSIDVPLIHIEELHNETSGAVFKGVGESGSIGSVPALSNAISDALSFCGAFVSRLPMSARSIRELIDTERPST